MDNWLLQLLTLIGAGTVVPGAVTWWLQRKAAREDRVEEHKQETSAAVIGESAKMREELWGQLQTALQRNDALAQQRGQLYQEKAELEGLVKVKEGQISDLTSRLTVALQQTDEARLLREKDRERLGGKIQEREATIAQLTGQVVSLQQQLAAQRGGPTRVTDNVPGGVTAVILPPSPEPEGEQP